MASAAEVVVEAVVNYCASVPLSARMLENLVEEEVVAEEEVVVRIVLVVIISITMSASVEAEAAEAEVVVVAEMRVRDKILTREELHL